MIEEVNSMFILPMGTMNYFEHLKVRRSADTELVTVGIVPNSRNALSAWREKRGETDMFRFEHVAQWGDPEAFFVVTSYQGRLLLTCENKETLETIERLYPWPT